MIIGGLSVRQLPLKRLASAVVLGGLLLRAIIPLGYMPGNLLAGELMVLCPTGVPAEVAHALHLHHHADAASIEADRTCPIGSALQYAALPTDGHAAFEAAPVRPVFLPRPVTVTGIRVRHGFRIRAPPSTTV